MRTRTKALLIVAGLAGAYGLYVVSLQFFAYTSDAFVANDVVLVAPEVEGRIVAVHVTDNQFVKAGEPLITLDPTPYALQVDLKAAALDKARADHEAAERTVARVEADRSSAVAHLNFARVTERRYGDLDPAPAPPRLWLLRCCPRSEQRIDQPENDHRKTMPASRSIAGANVVVGEPCGEKAMTKAKPACIPA